MFKRLAVTFVLTLLAIIVAGSALAGNVAARPLASHGGGGGGGGGGGTQPTPTPGTVDPLQILTSALGDGNVGTSYVSFITSSGGRGTPYRYSLIAGRLPDGLTMASSYGVMSTVITGKPTRVQTSSFTVRVQDGTGHTASAVFSITISPPRPLVITNPSSTLNAGTIGEFYVANLGPDGGTQPYTWSIIAGTLPPGLSMSTNGSITGTPRTAGTYTFTVRLADSAGQQVSQQFSITIS